MRGPKNATTKDFFPRCQFISFAPRMPPWMHVRLPPPFPRFLQLEKSSLAGNAPAGSRKHRPRSDSRRAGASSVRSSCVRALHGVEHSDVELIALLHRQDDKHFYFSHFSTQSEVHGAAESGLLCTGRMITTLLPLVFHVLSRKILLWKLLWEKNARGVSLITQELVLCVYLTRYMNLLYLFESFFVELVKVLHLIVALSCVLIIRYSPAVADSYDEDLDVVPRAAMLLPPLVLSLIFNKASHHA
jgi:hypothetical protein